MRICFLIFISFLCLNFSKRNDSHSYSIENYGAKRIFSDKRFYLNHFIKVEDAVDSIDFFDDFTTEELSELDQLIQAIGDSSEENREQVFSGLSKDSGFAQFVDKEKASIRAAAKQAEAIDVKNGVDLFKAAIAKTDVDSSSLMALYNEEESTEKKKFTKNKKEKAKLEDVGIDMTETAPMNSLSSSGIVLGKRKWSKKKPWRKKSNDKNNKEGYVEYRETNKTNANDSNNTAIAYQKNKLGVAEGKTNAKDDEDEENENKVDKSPTFYKDPTKNSFYEKFKNKKNLQINTELVNFKHTYLNQINTRYAQDVTIALSNKLFQGRYTGTRGQRLSLSFLNYELEKMGYIGSYQNSFVQLVNVRKSRVISTSLAIQDGFFKYGVDYHFNILNSIQSDGKPYNLIFIGLPSEKIILERCAKYHNPNGKNALLITPNNYFDIARFNKQIKTSIGKHYKIDLVCVLYNSEFDNQRQKIERDLKENINYTYCISSKRYNKYFVPTIFVNGTFIIQAYRQNISFQRLNDYRYKNAKYVALSTIKPININFYAQLAYEEMVVGNLIAVGKAFNPYKENIIISANYDGINETESANYNASGVAALLNIAKVFSRVVNTYELNKNVVFILFVGKHQGNLGSKFYNTHPLLSHNKTFLHISLDGLGLTYNTHKNEKFMYAYLPSHGNANRKLFVHNMNLNSSGGLVLDYSLSQNLSHVYNSDSYQFDLLGIPTLGLCDMNITEEQKRYFSSSKLINFRALSTRIKILSEFIWNISISATPSKSIMNKRQMFDIIEQRK